MPVLAQKEPERAKPIEPVGPSAPVNGSLVIVTNPPATEILINNEPRGRTNADGKLAKPLQLKPGKYTIVMRHREYDELRKEVNIRAGGVESLSASLIPQFGFIVMTVNNLNPQAKIELDGRILGETEIARDNDALRIKTAPGEHTLQISQSGYLAQQKTVSVDVNEPSIVAMVLERNPAVLIIKSQPGARLYLNGEESGKIPGSGELKLSKLTPERDYQIVVELSGYQTRQASVKTISGREDLIELTLTPLPTSAGFSDTFIAGLAQWTAPSEWLAENGILTIKGPKGLGVPKDKLYRDCDVIFGLHLLKARGAAWIVRAKDEKNFYLFYLSGPQGPYANQLRSYIVKDGHIDLAKPIDAQQSFPPLELDEFYRVRIQIRGNLIQHWLTPSKSGEEISIGLLRDADNSFPYGNVGFIVIDDEEFIVNGFVISLPDDKKAVQ